MSINYLLEQANHEGFCNVLYVLCGTFDFGINIFDADRFTNFSDDSVADQAITFRFLLNKDSRFAKRGIKVV